MGTKLKPASPSRMVGGSRSRGKEGKKKRAGSRSSDEMYASSRLEATVAAIEGFKHKKKKLEANQSINQSINQSVSGGRGNIAGTVRSTWRQNETSLMERNLRGDRYLGYLRYLCTLLGKCSGAILVSSLSLLHSGFTTYIEAVPRACISRNCYLYASVQHQQCHDCKRRENHLCLFVSQSVCQSVKPRTFTSTPYFFSVSSASSAFSAFSASFLSSAVQGSTQARLQPLFGCGPTSIGSRSRYHQGTVPTDPGPPTTGFHLESSHMERRADSLRSLSPPPPESLYSEYVCVSS
ncbi:hypothetical protein J3F83DRAFT_16315 [Trichoderma novae-zelandiae]